jgi:Cupin-like domain
MPGTPYEWRRWAAESRLMEVEPEEILRTLRRHGFDADAEVPELQSHPYLEAAGWIAQRLRKLETILDVLNDLASLTEPVRTIPVRRALRPDDFLREYYARNRPVLIDGLLDDWPARHRWSPAYFASVCGDMMVEVMDGREGECAREQYVNGRVHTMRLGAYVDMVLSAGSTNQFYLVGTNDFLQRPEASCLWQDVGVIEGYLDQERKAVGSSLWFGPAGTITPLHHDLMNILLAQVVGRKQIVLIPPTETHLVYNELGLFSEVDIEHPDFDRFPRFARATPVTIVLEPGQALFLPVGWWHHVRSLDVSISLSFMNFIYPNDYRWRNPRIDRSKTYSPIPAAGQSLDR